MVDTIVNPQRSADTKQLILQKTQEIICGKWRLAIIFELDTNTLRYGELRQQLPHISEKVLTQELKALIKSGVIYRQSYNEVPPRVEYTLTSRGRQVLPLLKQLTKVGEIFLYAD